MTIDFDSSIVLIFAVFYAGIIVFLRARRKKTSVYLFFFTVFFVYIVSAISYTQFPIYLSEAMRTSLGQNVWRNMNLLPFYTLGYESLKTLVLNILLTIPFGFGLPFIARLRLRQVVFIGVIFSIILEALQLVVALISGFTFRIVDINDVLFNGIGVAVGYALFVVFVRVIHLALDTWDIKQNAFLQYIYKQPQNFRKTIDINSINNKKNT